LRRNFIVIPFDKNALVRVSSATEKKWLTPY